MSMLVFTQYIYTAGKCLKHLIVTNREIKHLPETIRSCLQSDDLAACVMFSSSFSDTSHILL